MNIIIAGLLPPPNVAPELVTYVEKHCPALVSRFQAGKPEQTNLNTNELGCTPFEWLQLRQAGYTKQPGQAYGANMALLLSGVKDGSEPTYLGELSSVSVGREQLTMVHPCMTEIDQAEGDQLFESVSRLWEGTGISALPINARQWRIWLPVPATLESMTPACMAESRLSDWWPQDASLRGWRKLLNEIQMVWHDHPVNERRIRHEKPPINSIWLFGGAAPTARPIRQAAEKPVTILQTLADAHAAHDWARWISKLEQFDAQIAKLPASCEMHLAGHDKVITLTPRPTHWWHTITRPRPTNWRLWWNDQN